MKATGAESAAAHDRHSYFRRRAEQARVLAASAADRRVHGIHLEMAIRYELLAADGVAAVEGGTTD